MERKVKDCKESKSETYMMENRLGDIGFTRGFSQDRISITVGEQITVEQLIEKCIVMRISRQ